MCLEQRRADAELRETQLGLLALQGRAQHVAIERTHAGGIAHAQHHVIEAAQGEGTIRHDAATLPAPGERRNRPHEVTWRPRRGTSLRWRPD